MTDAVVFDDYGWETSLEYLSAYVDKEPKRLSTLKKFVANVSERQTLRKLVFKLYSEPGWCNFGQSVILEMANPLDAGFVRMMLALNKEHYQYNPISMHLWWRRLKAIGQPTIISYFNLTKFRLDHPDTKTVITWNDIAGNCAITSEVLNNIVEGLKSNKTVETNLRASLGISMSADIPEAYKKWVKKNHPDKGGDTLTFVLVKAAYEEWVAVTSNP